MPRRRVRRRSTRIAYSPSPLRRRLRLVLSEAHSRSAHRLTFVFVRDAKVSPLVAARIRPTLQQPPPRRPRIAWRCLSLRANRNPARSTGSPSQARQSSCAMVKAARLYTTVEVAPFDKERL
ncbi:hypothetical protein MRX96_017432 [Rhipicephalus microplus]